MTNNLIQKGGNKGIDQRTDKDGDQLIYRASENVIHRMTGKVIRLR